MSSFNKALDSKTHRHTHRRTVGDNLPHTKLCHYSYMQVHILFYYRQTAGRASLPVSLLRRHRTVAARPAAVHKRVDLRTETQTAPRTRKHPCACTMPGAAHGARTGRKFVDCSAGLQRQSEDSGDSQRAAKATDDRGQGCK